MSNMANMSAQITIGTKIDMSETLKKYGEFKKQIEGEVITYNIAGDKSQLDKVISEIKNADPNVDLVLNFSTDKYKKTLNLMKDMAGKSAVEISKIFNKSFSEVDGENYLNKILDGKSLKENSTKVAKTFLDLKTKVDSVDFSKITSIEDAKGAMEDIQKMTYLLSKLKDLNAPINLGGRVKFDVSKQETDLKDMTSSLSTVMAKNMSSWIPVFEDKAHKEFIALQNFASEIGVAISDGLEDALSEGINNGVNRGVNNARKTVDGLTTELSELENKLTNLENKKNGNGYSSDEVQKRRELKSKIESTLGNKTFRTKYYDSLKDTSQMSSNVAKKTVTEAIEFVEDKKNELKKDIDDFINLGGEFDRIDPMHSDFLSKLGFSKEQFATNKKDIDSEIQKTIDAINAKKIELENAKKSLNQSANNNVADGVSDSVGMHQDGDNVGNAGNYTATLTPKLSDTFKQEGQKLIDEQGDFNILVSGKIENAESFVENIEKQANEYKAEIDVTGTVNKPKNFADDVTKSLEEANVKARIDVEAKNVNADGTDKGIIFGISEDSLQGIITKIDEVINAIKQIGTVDDSNDLSSKIKSLESELEKVKKPAGEALEPLKLDADGLVGSLSEIASTMKEIFSKENGLKVHIDTEIVQSFKSDLETIRDIISSINSDGIKIPKDNVGSAPDTDDAEQVEDSTNKKVEANKKESESIVDVIKRIQELRKEQAELNKPLTGDDQYNNDLLNFYNNKLGKYHSLNQTQIVDEINAHSASDVINRPREGESKVRNSDLERRWTTIVALAERYKKVTGESFKFDDEATQNTYLEKRKAIIEKISSAQALFNKNLEVAQKLSSETIKRNELSKTASDVEKLANKMFESVSELEQLDTVKNGKSIKSTKSNNQKLDEAADIYKSYKDNGGELQIKDFTSKTAVINGVIASYEKLQQEINQVQLAEEEEAKAAEEAATKAQAQSDAVRNGYADLYVKKFNDGEYGDVDQTKFDALIEKLRSGKIVVEQFAVELDKLQHVTDKKDGEDSDKININLVPDVDVSKFQEEAESILSGIHIEKKVDLVPGDLKFNDIDNIKDNNDDINKSLERQDFLYNNIIKNINRYIKLQSEMQSGNRHIVDKTSKRADSYRNGYATKASIKRKIDNVNYVTKNEFGIYDDKSIEFAKEDLASYVAQYKSIDDAASIFGKKNAELFEDIKNRINNAKNALDAYKESIAVEKHIGSNVLELAGKDSWTLGQHDKFFNTLKTDGFNSAFKYLENELGFVIPNLAQQADESINQVLDNKHTSGESLINVPVNLTANIESLNSSIQAQKESIRPVDVKVNGKLTDLVNDGQDKSSLQRLSEYIKTTLIPAIDSKSEAFKNEANVVNGVVNDEIQDIIRLLAQIRLLAYEVEQLSGKIASLPPIRLEYGTVDNSTIESLNSLGQTVSDFNSDKLSSLMHDLNSLKLEDGLAQNIQSVANALLNLKSNINNISLNGNGFLDSIKELVGQADNLKALAKVITATDEQMKKAKGKIAEGATHEDNPKDANKKRGSTATLANKWSEEEYNDREEKILGETASIIEQVEKENGLVKSVTSFYDSMDNLIKTQIKVQKDINGVLTDETYTTGYSRTQIDKDGTVLKDSEAFHSSITNENMFKTEQGQIKEAKAEVSSYYDQIISRQKEINKLKNDIQDMGSNEAEVAQKQIKRLQEQIRYRRTLLETYETSILDQFAKKEAEISKLKGTDQSGQYAKERENAHKIDETASMTQSGYYDKLIDDSKKYVKALNEEIHAANEADRAIAKSKKRHYENSMDNTRREMSENGVEFDSLKEEDIQNRITKAHQKASEDRIKIANKEKQHELEIAERNAQQNNRIEQQNQKAYEAKKNRSIDKYNEQVQKDYYDVLIEYSKKYAKALLDEAKAADEADRAIAKSIKRHYAKEIGTLRDDMKANNISVNPDAELNASNIVTKAQQKYDVVNKQSIEEQVAYIKKINNEIDNTSYKLQKVRLSGSGDIFANKFNEASDEIKRLNNALSNQDITLTEYKSNVKQVLTELSSMKNAVKVFSDELTINQVKSEMDSYAASLSKNKAKVKSVAEDSEGAIKQITYAWIDDDNMIKEVTMDYDKMNGVLNASMKSQVDSIQGHLSWIDKLKRRWQEVFRYVASFASFYRIWAEIKQGVTYVKELDTALTEMRKVSDETVDSLKRFQSVSFNTAHEIGSTAKEIQSSAADFMRLGYNLQEASELAKDANIYANVGDMDIDEATEHMISSIKAWGSEFSTEVEASSAIIDKYNEIGNNFAITSADIGAAMERSAAALKAGGNTLDESLGLITAGNLIQQDAETTANALKVLSLRIRGSKTELEDMGEETDDLADSTSKLRAEIKALTGVDIMVDDNTYKSTAQIIKEIGSVWNQLNDIQQANVLEKLAGKTRASVVAGLMENYDVIDDVMRSAENSNGSASKENERYIDSVEGRLAQLQNAVQEFWYNLLSSKTVKNVIVFATNVIKFLDSVPGKILAITAAFKLASNMFAVKFLGKESGGRVKMSALRILIKKNKINMPPKRLAERCTSYLITWYMLEN